MTSYIKNRTLYQAISITLKTQIDNPSDVDSEVFANLFNIEQLAILQEEIAKAISLKVLGEP